MIYAIVQFVTLVFSAVMLFKFHSACGKNKHRYRPFVSMLAALWTGASAAVAVAILLAWPDAVSKSNFFTALISGISAGLAWWCGGNVAELLRKLMTIYRRLI